MPNLLSVSEAQDRIVQQFSPVSKAHVALQDAAGRILAEDISSPIDLPPFANSSMDGFAVRAADTGGASDQSPNTLRVIEDIPAGKPPQIKITPGTAARIMTGAQMPEGADAVVPVENTDANHDNDIAGMPESVQIFTPASNGDYVRPLGQDIRKGQVVLKKGRQLLPQDIGLLASMGITPVPVFRKPKLALFSTGDELIMPDMPLEPGKIRDANSYTLALLAEKHGCEVIRLGIAPDDPEKIRALLQSAVAQNADMIISSAGVSVGAFDYVKQLVEENGSLDFWRVNIRPGKPIAFGSYQNIPFIGLPGNPVSAFVGFLVFVLPAVEKLSGQPGSNRNLTPVVLGEDVKSDGRESYLRAIVVEKDGKVVATLASHQGSGNLFSLTLANALLIVPSGVKSLPVGAQAFAWMIN